MRDEGDCVVRARATSSSDDARCGWMMEYMTDDVDALARAGGGVCARVWA